MIRGNRSHLRFDRRRSRIVIRLDGFRLESDCSDIFRCPFPRSRKQHRCDGMELANRPQHGPVRNRRDTNGNVDYYRRAGPSISGGSHGQLRYGFGITHGSVANAYIQCRGVCHRRRIVQFSVVSLAFTISPQSLKHRTPTPQYNFLGTTFSMGFV